MLNQDCFTSQKRGVTRRQFLETGAAAGAALTASGATSYAAGRDVPSLIHIYLPGGPSHLDTFDLKPQAPAETRGEFRPISTAADGVQICELFPRLAKWAGHFTIIRSITGLRDEHSPEASDSGFGDARQEAAGGRPGVGAVLAATSPRQLTTGCPVAVDLSGWTRAGFLRCGCQDGFDVAGVDKHHHASSMPSVVADACNMERAWPAALERYGVAKRPDNANFLRARRLIEAGARYVGLSWGFWDNHANNFPRLRRQLPWLDMGLAALIEDLAWRGRLDNVMIMISGEFGRSPQINDAGGRDHWPRASSVLLAGGPLNHGQAIGSTDCRGGEPASRPVHLDEIFATVYRALGVDAMRLRLTDRNGRPQRLLPPSTPLIPELRGGAASHSDCHRRRVGRVG